MDNGGSDKDLEDGEDVVWVDTDMRRAGKFTMDTVVGKLGVSAEALLRYEALGLVSPVTYGKVRVYEQSDCDCLTLILRDRHLTKALDRIARLLEDATAHPAAHDFERGRESCDGLIARLEKQRSDISTILAHLRRVYTVLTLRAKGRASPGK